MMENKKRQFLVIKFDGLLMPLYIKLHPMHLSNVNTCGADEAEQCWIIDFTTGYFDYRSNQFCKITKTRDNRFGQDHVQIKLPFDTTEWFRYEWLDEDCDDVKWSRKYFSEVHGIKYERPTED